MKRQAVPNDFWDLTKLDSGTIVYDIIRGPDSIVSNPTNPDGGVGLLTPSGLIVSPWRLLNTGLDNSLRLIIMRGPAGWCCYIGVPLDSPLAGLPYSGEMERFECHGGLTFAGPGDGIHRPEGWYYFGWDYAHSGDWTAYFDSIEESARSYNVRKWTFGEVKSEIEADSLQMQELLANLSKSKVFPKRFFNRKRLIRIRVNGAELI
jgi:hypothetical protein